MGDKLGRLRWAGLCLGLGGSLGSLELAWARDVSVLARRPPERVLGVAQLSSEIPGPGSVPSSTFPITREPCGSSTEMAQPREINRLSRYELVDNLERCGEAGESELLTRSALAEAANSLEEDRTTYDLVEESVDNLAAQATALEETRFSPLTKLHGTAVFGVNDLIGGNFSDPTGQATGNTLTTNLAVNYRSRLTFDTSFSGQDLLRIRMQAANFPNYGSLTGTNMGRLSIETNTANQVELNTLFYRFVPSPQAQVTVDLLGGSFDHSFLTYNSLLSSSEKGAISRFGRFNPVYDIKGGTGLALVYDISRQADGRGITFNLGYLAGRSASVDDSGCSASNQAPCFNAGYPGPNPIFGGPTGGLTGAYGAMVQVDFKPTPRFAVGLNYVRSFGLDVSGGSGSTYAQNPFGSGPTSNFRNNQADSFGLQFTTRPMARLKISGWVGYSSVKAGQGLAVGQSAEVLNYALTLGIPDLLNQGDVLGIIVGQPPQLIRTDHPSRPAAFNAYHLELLYRMQLSPNVAVTPGIFTVINPNSNSANPPLVLGVIRTTFTF